MGLLSIVLYYAKYAHLMASVCQCESLYVSGWCMWTYVYRYMCLWALTETRREQWVSSSITFSLFLRGRSSPWSCVSSARLDNRKPHSTGSPTVSASFEARLVSAGCSASYVGSWIQCSFSSVHLFLVFALYSLLSVAVIEHQDQGTWEEKELQLTVSGG